MKRFITDPRLHRIFTFQALYAGVPPQRALAVYAVIAYMDTVAGVYFPRGGMRALPDALAAAAADAGVEFRYGATVSGLDRRRRPRSEPWTPTQDERIHADAVVLTTELPDTYRLLGRTPRRLLPLRPSPSAVVAHVGCRSAGPRNAAPPHPFRRHLGADVPRHHRRRRGDERPVTAGDQADGRRSHAGADRAATCSTFWRPHRICRGAQSIGTASASSYADSMMAAVTDRLPQLGVDAELLHVVNPADWARQGMVAGTPVRAGAHVRPDGTVPSGQHRSRHRQRRAGRLVDRARCRRSDRPDVGATGRRPDHRSRHPARSRLTSGAGSA